MMLLQTNSYIVPKDKRAQHARLVQRFRQCLTRLGCDHFEAYEQVGANWSPADTTGRFVQLMRFRDRKHQLAVQAAERNDPAAQSLIKEFCELINFPYQQQQGLFAVGFYHSLLPSLSPRDAVDDAAEDEYSDESTEPPIPMSAEPGRPPAVPTIARIRPLEPEPLVGEEISNGEIVGGELSGDEHSGSELSVGENSADEELNFVETPQDPDAAALEALGLDDLDSDAETHMRIVPDEDDTTDGGPIKAEGHR